jgi:hypothetical protein
MKRRMHQSKIPYLSYSSLYPDSGDGCRPLAYKLYGKLNSCNTYHGDYLKNMVYNSFWNATCMTIDQLKEIQEKGKMDEFERTH